MDFHTSNVGHVKVEFKDPYSDISTQRRSVDVILVDRTNPGNFQKCYILKNDAKLADTDFEKFKDGYYDFNENDFICIGDVLTINKTLKYVVLEDKNTLSYVHLIIAFGSHYSLLNYEFLAGVHTLVDAIRVRKKIPSTFAIINNEKSDLSITKKVKSSKNIKGFSNPKAIDSLQQKKLVRNNDSSPRLDSTKRLYEVQI